MDALTFDIRVWVGATGDAGDGVNGFVRLKSQIQFLFLSLPSSHFSGHDSIASCCSGHRDPLDQQLVFSETLRVLLRTFR